MRVGLVEDIVVGNVKVPCQRLWEMSEKLEMRYRIVRGGGTHPLILVLS